VAEAAAAGGMRTVFFGSPATVGGRDGVSIARIEPLPGGLSLALVERAAANVTERPCTLPMLGRYNAWNAAAALAAARALGVDGGSAVRALERFAGVPGRLERVEAGQPFAVVVDYAHTPDALERALAACREHATGRVLLVFGCGGDRDRGKRPLMGAVAARDADRAWVTNDNPRSEDPKTIADAILAGVPQGTTARFNVVLDRRAAIAAALGEARPGDLVLVAGKGHETTQTTAGVVVPFDDREVARELLRAASRGGLEPGPVLDPSLRTGAPGPPRGGAV
jgi:UDP-N-acetylmuramoyl-L-alanyl-D-glutamate--2,6-diaminopimelate ligase